MTPRTKKLLALCCLLACAGCSSGRLTNQITTPETNNQKETQHKVDLINLASCAKDTLAINSINRNNSLFVHPGLLLSNLDWDRSLAMEAGDFLRDKSYSTRIIEVRDRSANTVRQKMLEDPGVEFVGIHYSMGGNPHYLRASIEATREAGIIRGTQLRYHAIMIDPSGIGDIESILDVETPEIGYIFVILSSERSMLRPSVQGFSQKLLDSGKVYVMHAEDFGEDWNHFGMLEALRTFKNGETSSGRKVEALLEYMVAVALGSNGKLGRLPGLCGTANGLTVAKSAENRP